MKADEHILLQEVMFDVAFATGQYWARLDSKIADELMDAMDGSRGLFQHCLKWANEFHSMWTANLPDEEPEQDYLIAIDDFTFSKINVLIASTRLDQ